MSIPRLNGKGVLPPINGEPYATTSLELCQRYGTKPERRAVLRGLLDLRAAMRDLQFDGGWQWVAGEFLEDDRLHPKPPALIKYTTLWQGQMSRQASTGLSVGFLRMDLNTASDDTAALEYLKRMEAGA